MKLVAILLFTFELLAPALFESTNEASITKNEEANFAPLTHSLDILSHLIFEEISSEEERESKDHNVLTPGCYIEVFSTLKKFETAKINWQLPKEKFDTQPSLFTLYRVLLI